VVAALPLDLGQGEPRLEVFRVEAERLLEHRLGLRLAIRLEQRLDEQRVGRRLLGT